MEKIIQIANKNDLQKFYKKLPFYKSFVFKFTTFKISKDKYNITDIIDALNIKNRKNRITFIYDTACKQIDQKYEGKNICGFVNNKCYSQRKAGSDKFNGCCRLCRFQNSKGCPTKNLACKLVFCSEVEKRHEIVKFEDLKLLNCLSKRQRFMLKSNYFSSREEILRDLYIGSLLIGTVRVSYRMFKTFLYHKRIKKSKLVLLLLDNNIIIMYNHKRIRKKGKKKTHFSPDRQW